MTTEIEITIGLKPINQEITAHNVTTEAFASPAEARAIAALMRHRTEDDATLVLNPQLTRRQLIRDRFDRLVYMVCG